MDLFPQHEVAFPVHHQLLVNPLEFELVVSVEVVAVVLDLVSIPGAHVLVSPVALVRDEIAVVVDPIVIAVSMVATRTVVAHVVSAEETLSVAAVVADPAVWVHHVWSAHQDHLHHFLISISRISRSEGDAIRSCSFASVSSSDIV